MHKKAEHSAAFAKLIVLSCRFSLFFSMAFCLFSLMWTNPAAAGVPTNGCENIPGTYWNDGKPVDQGKIGDAKYMAEMWLKKYNYDNSQNNIMVIDSSGNVINIRDILNTELKCFYAYNPPDQMAEKVKSGHSGNHYGCLGRGPHTEACLVVGALASAFRFQTSGKHDVYGGISGDIFVGVNSDLLKNFTPLVYVGYLSSFSSSTATTSGSSGGGNSGVLDFGVGIAMPIHTCALTSACDNGQNDNKSSASRPHVALLFGTNTGLSGKYNYNGKPYVTMAFGISF